MSFMVPQPSVSFYLNAFHSYLIFYFTTHYYIIILISSLRYNRKFAVYITWGVITITKSNGNGSLEIDNRS